MNPTQADRLWIRIHRGFEERRASLQPIPPDLSLKELRRSLRISQETLAARLGVRQARVSKWECRPDLPVSTLRAYLEALGGTLDLQVRFPNRAARISGFTCPRGRRAGRPAGATARSP